MSNFWSKLPLKTRSRWLRYGLFILFLTAILVWLAIFQRGGASQEQNSTQTNSDQKLAVYYLDIGQGDSEFIDSPTHFQVLIDGGPTEVVLSKLGTIMPYYDREINLVILTHPDADHLRGLVAVMERYQIDLLVWTGVEHNSALYAEFKKLLASKNIKQQIALAGQNFDLGDGAKLIILFPTTSLSGQNPVNNNNTSVASKLIYGKNSWLFLGDAESEEQQQFMSSQNVSAKILQAPHHGSRNGLTESFLRAVNPAIVMISVGADNKYGHPHKEVLEMIKNFGAKMYRTDQQGTITVTADKENYSIKTEK